MAGQMTCPTCGKVTYFDDDGEEIATDETGSLGRIQGASYQEVQADDDPLEEIEFDVPEATPEQYAMEQAMDPLNFVTVPVVVDSPIAKPTVFRSFLERLKAGIESEQATIEKPIQQTQEMSRTELKAELARLAKLTQENAGDDELERLLLVVRKANEVLSERTITIEVEGGCVTEVHNLPDGWNYRLDDHDCCEEYDEDDPAVLKCLADPDGPCTCGHHDDKGHFDQE